MKVFISWSGERSQQLATTLRDWLPLMLHYVQPWLSNSDIKAGDRWSIEIAKELEASNFGIICVTKDNINSPWILFESGAIAKSMEDGRLIPLLLDLDFRQISGPLAQFQAKKVDSGGIKDLTKCLNNSASTPISENNFVDLFDALYPRFEGKISDIPKSQKPARQTRPEFEILEELVSGIRNVEGRLRDATDDGRKIKINRNSRFASRLVLDLADLVSEGPGDTIRLLIIARVFREDFPWLYELVYDLYKSSGTRPLRGTSSVRRRLANAIESLMCHPLLAEYAIDRHLLQALMREVMFFERDLSAISQTESLDDAPKNQVEREKETKLPDV